MYLLSFVVPRGRIALPTYPSSGESSTTELPRHKIYGFIFIKPSLTILAI